MPEFYSKWLHRKYHSIWGVIRMIWDPPPRIPPLPEGAVELPVRVERIYAAETPAGFPCSYRVELDVKWALPLESECEVRLSKQEFDEVLKAWEIEIRDVALAESFLAFTLVWSSEYQQALPTLLLWRLFTMPRTTDVAVDTNGLWAQDALNRLAGDWNHTDVAVHVRSIRAHDPDDDANVGFGRLLPAQLKRLEALASEDVGNAQTIVFRWLQQFKELNERLMNAVASQEQDLAMLNDQRRNSRPYLIERQKTLTVVEAQQETDEIL